MGKDLVNGSKMVAPMFLSVGENAKISINDIKVTGYEKEDGTSGDVYIKILDRMGAVDKDEDGVSKWYFFYDDEDTEELGAGWYQDDDVSEEMKMGDSFGFDPGFGLWVNGTTDFSLVIKAPTIQ